MTMNHHHHHHGACLSLFIFPEKKTEKVTGRKKFPTLEGLGRLPALSDCTFPQRWLEKKITATAPLFWNGDTITFLVQFSSSSSSSLLLLLFFSSLHNSLSSSSSFIFPLLSLLRALSKREDPPPSFAKILRKHTPREDSASTLERRRAKKKMSLSRSGGAARGRQAMARFLHEVMLLVRDSLHRNGHGGGEFSDSPPPSSSPSPPPPLLISVLSISPCPRPCPLFPLPPFTRQARVAVAGVSFGFPPRGSVPCGGGEESFPGSSQAAAGARGAGGHASPGTEAGSSL